MSDTWGNHVAITVEGVLKTPNDESPIMAGILLYKSLCQSHRVSLILDGMNRERLQYWLIINSLTDHVGEVYYEKTDPEDHVQRRLNQINRLKREGPLSMVFESDMDVVHALFKSGTPSMMYMHPSYVHPDFHPTAKTVVTPWADLYAEQKRQRQARAADDRINKLMEGD